MSTIYERILNDSLSSDSRLISVDDWGAFDFEFTPRTFTNNAIIYSTCLLCFICLYTFCYRINSPCSHSKWFIISVCIPPSCTVIFAFLFNLNFWIDIIYIHRYFSSSERWFRLVTSLTCKLFNGIAKTNFLISMGILLIQGMWTAHYRRNMGRILSGIPYLLSLIFSIIWLLFFSNRLHNYFLIADFVILSFAFCILFFCSTVHYGSPDIEPEIRDARSNLLWSVIFFIGFIPYYSYFEIFYKPGWNKDAGRTCEYYIFTIFGLLLLPSFRKMIHSNSQPQLAAPPEPVYTMYQPSAPPMYSPPTTMPPPPIIGQFTTATSRQIVIHPSLISYPSLSPYAPHYLRHQSYPQLHQSTTEQVYLTS